MTAARDLRKVNHESGAIRTMMQNEVIKSILAIAILLVFMTATLSEARDFRVRKRAGNFIVDVTLDKNPPILGNCDIRIEIHDGQGVAVTGSRVLVNYYMPPMPGMVPMNYTIQTTPKGSSHVATMHFIMTGPWNIVIQFNSGGSHTQLQSTDRAQPAPRDRSRRESYHRRRSDCM
jgi:hypothetical protein